MYAANLSNCDAYWFKRRCELEATIELEGDGRNSFFLLCLMQIRHGLMTNNWSK